MASYQSLSPCKKKVARHFFQEMRYRLTDFCEHVSEKGLPELLSSTLLMGKKQTLSSASVQALSFGRLRSHTCFSRWFVATGLVID